MLVGHGADQVVGIEQDETKFGNTARPFHDGHVQIIVVQTIIKILYGIGDDRDDNAGVPVAVFGQDLSHNIALSRMGDADPKPGQRLVLVSQRGLKPAIERVEPAGETGGRLTGFGQPDGAFAPVEESDTQFFFQLADVLADGRLRQIEPFRGLGEVLQFGDGQEGRDFSIDHKIPPPIMIIDQYSAFDYFTF